MFLDIETSGLDKAKDSISYIGSMLDYSVDIRRPQEFGCLSYSGDLVTFNGTAFDLPFIGAAGLELKFGRHIDLMQVVKDNWSDGRLISKDMVCRDLGIYVPRDPAGSGKRVAALGRKIVAGSASPQEHRLVMQHLAQDLFVTAELYDYCLNEGWIPSA